MAILFLDKQWIQCAVIVLMLLGSMTGARADSANLSAHQKAWIAQHPVITFALEQDYAPFIYTDSTGSPKGLSVDFLMLIGEKAGLKFQASEESWPLPEILERSRDRSIDMVTSLRPTPDRALFLGFTSAYVSVPVVLILRNSFTEHHALGTMSGHQVAVSKGYTVEDFVRKRYPQVQWIAVSNDKEALNLLVAGTVDGAVADVASAQFLMRRQSIKGIRLADPVGWEYPLSFAYRNDWPVLGEILQQGLLAISANEHDQIISQWLPPEVWNSRRLIPFIAAGLLLLGLALGYGWWTRHKIVGVYPAWLGKSRFANLDFPVIPAFPKQLAQFGVQHFLLAVGSIILFHRPGDIAVFWYANALGAVYLIDEPKPLRWLPFLACAAMTNGLAGLVTGHSLALSLVFLPGNLLESLVAATLVRANSCEHKFSENPGKLICFLLMACGIPPLLGATASAATFAFNGIASFTAMWPVLYMGAAIGSVALLPFGLLLKQKKQPLFYQIQWTETLSLLLLTAIVIMMALSYSPFPFIYIIIPLMISALKVNFISNALLIWLSSMIIGIFIATGYFVPPPIIAQWQIILIYLPILITLIPPLLLAASTEEKLLTLEELINSETRLRVVLNASPVPQILRGPIMTFLNPAFTRTFGYTLEDIPTRNDWWLRAYPEPEYRQWATEIWQAALEKAKREGTPSIPLELEVRCKNGTVKTVLASATLLDKTLEDSYLVVLYDITERKQMEEALRASEALFHAVFENAAVGIVQLSLTGRFLQINQEFCRIIGYSQDEVLSQKLTFQQITFPEDIAPDLAHVNTLLSGVRDHFDMEKRYIRKDGGIVWVSLSVRLLRNDAGAPLFFIAAVQDINQRKIVEEELRFHSMILNNLAEGVALTHVRDRTIVFANPQFERILGYEAGELLGKPVSIVNAPGEKNPEAVADAIISELVQTGVWNGEVQNVKKDGTVVWCHASVSTFHHPQFGPVWVSIHTDITERKRRERHLWLLDFSLSHVRDAACLADESGHFIYVNNECCRVLGYGKNQLLNLSVFDVDSHVSREHWAEQWREMKKQGSCTFESHHKTRDGQIIPVEIAITPFEYEGNAYHIAFARNITERKQAETRLRIAATVFEAQEGMMITDANSVILQVNRAFTDITGYPASLAVGQTPRLLQSGRHDAAFYAEMWDCIQRIGAWHGEVWNRRQTGEVYPQSLSITAVKDNQDAIIHYVGTLADITIRKATDDQIRHLAFYDPLTQLPNRRLLLDRLQQALVTCTRSQQQGALFFIDLDKFKTLNDTLGHKYGDLLLQQVAQRLTTCVREGDTVARLGGDEFVVMLENLNKNAHEAAVQAQMIGDKILAALNQPYPLAEHFHHCTPSIGITLFSDRENSVDELLKQADLSMYQAKAAGRNTLRFFDPTMQTAVTARAALEADLYQGLQENQFLLYYQAQVDDTGHLTGAEALVRWRHPQRGLVSPAEFIPLAEETGIILPLGYWVLETACAQLAMWATRPDRIHLTLAVNVSARQFLHPNFVTQVLTILDHSGANPQKLKLELTESLLLNDIEDIVAKMTTLKAKGVSFSLDDFGIGYSSLSYLKRLPLDQLKIDQSFVRDVLTDPNDATIARTIVALAHSLGLAVIAEGVETEAQSDFLSDNGCHAFQGYLFGRPQPEETFCRERPTPADMK